jgi:hypothetical protein
MYVAKLLFGRECEYFLMSCPVEQINGCKHVVDYIWAWLVYGGGAKLCSGNHSLLLSIVVLAAERWMTMNTSEDGLPALAREVDTLGPPLDAIFGHGCQRCEAVFDPSFVQLLATDPEYEARAIAEDAS